MMKKMLLKYAVVGLLLGLPWLQAAAQGGEVWSLKDCIDYAIAHNVSVRRQALNEENQRIALETSRYSRLPNLNANLGQGFGFGRSSARDGSTVDKTSASTNFSVSSSMSLFTGFRIPNQVKSDEFSLKASMESLNKAKYDLSIQITGFYLQALYYQGMVQIQEQQVKLNEEQVQVARELVASGRKPQSELAEAEAQLASAVYNQTSAVGNARLARLDLCQALNLQQVTDIRIADPDTVGVMDVMMPLPETVFQKALQSHPAILASEYELESRKYAYKVTRSNLFPQLSLSASYSNSFFHQYGSDYNQSLSKQLDLNGSEYVGLSLNIPIFNRFATRNALKQSRLNIENYALMLDEAKNTLQKEIQQAYFNADKARENNASAERAATASAIAYDYEQQRYEAGKSTNFELNSAKMKLEKAQQDALQAKYEYLMRLKILEFYNGVSME